MISGSTATMSYAAPQTLPSCTDPTGQNLPCMMVISTLPPPPNALQCQETSGQILPCSYMTQNLSNGEQIVAISVYIPANFVFTSPTVIKVVVHEKSGTTGGGTGGSKTILHKLLVAIGIAKDPIVRGNIQTISVTVSDSKIPSKKIQGVEASGEVDYPSHKTTKMFSGITDSTGQMSPSYSWQIGGHSDNGTFIVKVKASKTGYVEGFATKTFRVICKFATECGHMINQTNSTITNNMTNTTSTPPTNKTVATSGGEGQTYAAGNCTTRTAPPVDCTKNPNDPSCTQTLAPSTTTSPPPTPTTKTCPDGSVIDASATCPTASTIPPSSSTPPPPSNNPSGGSGSSNGGGSSGGRSSPSSPDS